MGIPAHFTLRAQSPGRGALSSGTRNKSSLKAQGCDRGRLYARHLAKRPKKWTDSAQEQHREKAASTLLWSPSPDKPILIPCYPALPQPL